MNNEFSDTESLPREELREDFPTACPIGPFFLHFLCSLVQRIIKESWITDVSGAIVVVDVFDEV